MVKSFAHLARAGRRKPRAFSLAGRLFRESANPINRALITAYRPIITRVLRHRWPVISAAVAVLVLTWIPWSRIGSEFMPRLDEGTILYMPTTLPGMSVTCAREILRIQDSVLTTFPEVERAQGKAGLAKRIARSGSPRRWWAA